MNEMAPLKCNMCGGDIEVSPGSSIGTCKYCRTTWPVPRMNSSSKISLLSRANYYRRHDDYDRAAKLFDEILKEDDSDPEVYWSLFLCRNGVKYEVDPETGVQMPTINRMQAASVLADADYVAACEHADAQQKSYYKQEAKRINEYQQKIRIISSQESPYDVFVSYKETDENGHRTEDYLLARQIYDALTEKNLKVFFAAKTLKGKLGTEYEPYIFAALNSAKAMVLVGTRPEHVNAVWVKNEWSRYLAMIRKGAKKTLIVAFKGMAPEKLPDELAGLAALNMAEISSMMDLTDFVVRIAGADKPKTEPGATAAVPGPTLRSQIKRGNQSLEDRDWGGAVTFFEKALDIDPDCADAHLGKALAAAKLRSLQELVAERTGRVVEEPEPTFCDVDTDRIRAVAQACAIPVYYPEEQIVSRFDQCKRDYLSCSGGWERLLNEERAYWSSDRNMSRALRYAKGKLGDELLEARQSCEQYLEQALRRTRDEDGDRRTACERAYTAELDQTERSINEESLAARRRREEDYQSFLRQCNSAKTAKEFEALGKRNDPGLIGYRDYEQLRKQCQEETERLRTEEEKKKAEIRKKRTGIEKRIKHQQGWYKFVGFLYYVYLIVIATVIISGNKYHFIRFQLGDDYVRPGLGRVTLIFLLLLALRCFFAGMTGKSKPILTGLVGFSGFSYVIGTMLEGYLRYTSPFAEKVTNFLDSISIDGVSFLGKYTVAAFIVSLLVILIFGGIGKRVTKSRDKFMTESWKTLNS